MLPLSQNQGENYLHLLTNTQYFAYFILTKYCDYFCTRRNQAPGDKGVNTMLKLSEERRMQIERAKDNAPSTSLFIWFIPCLFILAWVCRNDTYVAPHYSMPETSLKILGWELF
jgi:hypothetical protein